MRRFHFPCWLAGFAALGCGEGPTETPAPTTGGIEVTTVTTGDPIDLDGFVLALDQGHRSIGSNTTLTIGDLEPGDHQVELLGIAANCALSGPNPRTVHVEEGPPLQVTLRVSCLTDRGTIAVSIRTAGMNLDPDGYSLALDGEPASPSGRTVA